LTFAPAAWRIQRSHFGWVTVPHGPTAHGGQRFTQTGLTPSMVGSLSTLTFGHS